MGFKHVGKKVETSELRIDKNIFFEKAKAVIGFKRLTIDTKGRANNELVGRRDIALSDDNVKITTDTIKEGLLTINPTSNRTKSTPTATEFIDDILDIDGESLTASSYEAFEFSIINTSGSSNLIVSAGTGVTSVGSMRVLLTTSARFQIVKTGTAAVSLYRLA